MGKSKYIKMTIFSLICLFTTFTAAHAIEIRDTWINTCKDPGVLKALQLVGYGIIFVKIAVPLLLIIFASVELGKAVISNDDKAIKVAVASLAKKAIAGVIVFFIPTIVHFVVYLVDSAGNYEREYLRCSTCLNDPSDCNPESDAPTKDLFVF